MAKVNFTASRIASYQCDEGKGQSFMWDATAPGLGLRATSSGAKSYMFQSKLNGQTMRITIGSPNAWSIQDAQAEARRLKVMVDNGLDPRQVKADAKVADENQKAAAAATAIRESATFQDVWAEYVAERRPQWSERHAADHDRMIAAGGQPRSRSNKKVTIAAPLAALMHLRLVDLTSGRVDDWAKKEGETRPTSARLALRLLKACLNWCAVHPVYSQVVTTNPAESKKARESLGKQQVKQDVLQREQLAHWFAAVRQIGNPVTSAYLQCLLLTGARREEITRIKWNDVDFQWKSITIRDKVDGIRVIPLTPYVEHLISPLPRRNEWVFSSPSAEDGCLADPTPPHKKACEIAGLVLTLHGLRRSFASLCEWTETPAGIAAQIQGHKPQGVRERNYIRRPLDLLRMWHVKIESWMLTQADVTFTPVQAAIKLVV